MEARVNGVLCHRETENDEWEPYSLEAMAIALTAMRNAYDNLKEEYGKTEKTMSSLRNVLDHKTTIS